MPVKLRQSLTTFYKPPFNKIIITASLKLTFLNLFMLLNLGFYFLSTSCLAWNTTSTGQHKFTFHCDYLTILL